MKKSNQRSKVFSVILSALAILLCTSYSSYSQSAFASDAYITMDDAAAPGALFAGTYYVFLSDSSNVSQIEINLGTSDGANDIMTNTYTYDVSSGLPSGYTYVRAGNKLTLGIGNYTEKNTYFGSVRIKDNSGSWSSPFKFISN